MIQRHFNAFLKKLGIKQLFWGNVRSDCIRHGINYQHKKSELYSYRKELIIRAFCWIDYPEPPNLTWPDVHKAWEKYMNSHYVFR
jgi:hypothetical protein